jgi:hypothetical protein
MDGRLEIFTTGGVCILRGGEPLADLGYQKVEFFWINLASTRRFQSDEVLADLLSEELALTTLGVGIQTSTGRVSLIFLNAK